MTELTDEGLKAQLLKYGVNPGPIVGEAHLRMHVCALIHLISLIPSCYQRNASSCWTA